MNRSTIFNITRFAIICVIETSSDEFFSVNEDPVLVNISVTYAKIVNVPERKLSASEVKEMKNARFACGVTKKNKNNVAIIA